MDLRPTYIELDQLLVTFKDKLLSPTAFSLLRSELHKLLNAAVTKCMGERMFYLRAGELRAMGAILPDEITDEHIVACRQTREDAVLGTAHLVIETTAGLPGRTFMLEKKDEPADDQSNHSAAGSAHDGAASENANGAVAPEEQS